MRKGLISYSVLVFIIMCVAVSCSDEMEVQTVEVPEQSEAAINLIGDYNKNIAALQIISEGRNEVMSVEEDGTILFDNHAEMTVRSSDAVDKDIPVFGVDESGHWIYSLNGETLPLTGLSDNPVRAISSSGEGVVTPMVGISKDGYWQVSFNGVQWKKLSSIMAPSLDKKTPENYALFKSSSVNGKILSLQSAVGNREYTIHLPDDNMAEAWKRFVMKTDDNVLLDYSYAGYMRGTVAPADAFAWGYEVVNVKDYMKQHKISSPRQALNKIMYDRNMVRKCPGEANKTSHAPEARVVIYFPEGEYVMQDGTEADKFPEILAGNFIIKGAGKDKTKLLMTCIYDGYNLPEVYKSTLIAVKHTNSPYNLNHSKLYAKVTANAKKGDFSVQAELQSGMKLEPGMWVQLRLRSNDDGLVREELGPLYDSQNSGSWTIRQEPGCNPNGNEDGNGVRIVEFHQVKGVSGNKIVFHEPIMTNINIDYADHGGWEIRGYIHYENVGVEDLTFVGSAITPYYHHGDGSGCPQEKTWIYDEGFKPVSFTRVVNSWIRNVAFESVSEAMTFGESANCSAYNIEIRGHRGHSAVRAAGSSRVFIGAVSDLSEDTKGDGQWHGVGVSKPSVGSVIWNSNWGSNACFESHASQPRATLFDNCSGGLVRYHAGGAEQEAPNHLRDLTIWNLDVTGTVDEKNTDWSADFKWWDGTNKWWQVYPPIVVGTHGKNVSYSKDEYQLTYEEATGMKVSPESVYEAQLRRRLGFVPAWLQGLK